MAAVGTTRLPTGSGYTVNGGIAGGGAGILGGIGGAGTVFRSIVSGKPGAAIKPPKVGLPSRGDFGAPVASPTVGDPNRANYGTPDRAGLQETSLNAREAEASFNNPRGTGAFRNLMGLAQEQTGQQASEVAREARDASQRRGYAGGFEDTARQTQQDRMSALASAGFQGADAIQQREGEQYGRAIGAFTQLQTSYNEAKQQGDTAFASDLTKTHIENAENVLKTAGLNMQQQLAYAGALNDAKQLQAKLDQDFNNSLIDNNRYIQGQQQIAAQLLAQQMALEEKKREFNIDTGEQEKTRSEQEREFDLGLKANPGTALRTFSDPRYGGDTGRQPTTNRGAVFTGLS